MIADENLISAAFESKHECNALDPKSKIPSGLINQYYQKFIKNDAIKKEQKHKESVDKIPIPHHKKTLGSTIEPQKKAESHERENDSSAFRGPEREQGFMSINEGRWLSYRDSR